MTKLQLTCFAIFMAIAGAASAETPFCAHNLTPAENRGAQAQIASLQSELAWLSSSDCRHTASAERLHTTLQRMSARLGMLQGGNLYNHVLPPTATMKAQYSCARAEFEQVLYVLQVAGPQSRHLPSALETFDRALATAESALTGPRHLRMITACGAPA